MRRASLLGAALGVALLVSASCINTESPEVKKATAKLQGEERLQHMADITIDQIHYAKDPRTGFCFAYYKSGYATSIALVPEEKIPAHLLRIARIANEPQKSGEKAGRIILPAPNEDDTLMFRGN